MLICHSFWRERWRRWRGPIACAYTASLFVVVPKNLFCHVIADTTVSNLLSPSRSRLFSSVNFASTICCAPAVAHCVPLRVFAFSTDVVHSDMDCYQFSFQLFRSSMVESSCCRCSWWVVMVILSDFSFHHSPSGTNSELKVLWLIEIWKLLRALTAQSAHTQTKHLDRFISSGRPLKRTRFINNICNWMG